jgi:hypothetical protein
MNLELPLLITIRSHGRTFTAELPWDADMDQIAEALRANLRELAQADARMLRELDGAQPLMAQTEPRVAGVLADGLDRLGVKELKALCKERGFKGYTALNKAALIQRLRGDEAPLAAKAAVKTTAKAVVAPSELAAIEARLDRMEALLQRIAERVGVSDAGTGALGRSDEAEHRAILAAALMSPPRRNLAELLGSMPDVGLDADFER